MHFTDNPNLANITLTEQLVISNEWIYVSDNPSTVAHWIYISKSPSTVAEWVYISDKALGADVIIYADNPTLKRHEVVAAILEHLRIKSSIVE